MHVCVDKDCEDIVERQLQTIVKNVLSLHRLDPVLHSRMALTDVVELEGPWKKGQFKWQHSKVAAGIDVKSTSLRTFLPR